MFKSISDVINFIKFAFVRSRLEFTVSIWSPLHINKSDTSENTSIFIIDVYIFDTRAHARTY